MIWVSGESLIDLLPSGPVPGGGAANTAIALARLGVPTSFVGGLSSDEYGKQLSEHLESNNVDLTSAMRSELPTALAKITLNKTGSASYEFVLENTATFSFEPRYLPTGKPKVLHIGSLATVIEPSATALFEWAKELQVPVVFDPNVRPAVMSDVARYRDAVMKWASISSVIKLSDEDLNFLFPGHSEQSALRELMQPSVQLIVLTRGKDGVMGVTREQTVAVPGLVVDVVDTVGAGDTVGAVVAAALLDPDAFDEGWLERTLERAVRAAAITCTRAGCNPPTAAELA